jgi:hypothetical protein
MEVCRDSATQYGESEKCIFLFSPKSGDRRVQYSGDEILVCVRDPQRGEYYYFGFLGCQAVQCGNKYVPN